MKFPGFLSPETKDFYPRGSGIFIPGDRGFLKILGFCEILGIFAKLRIFHPRDFLGMGIFFVGISHQKTISDTHTESRGSFGEK